MRASYTPSIHPNSITAWVLPEHLNFPADPQSRIRCLTRLYPGVYQQNIACGE
jgi:hypothetical protein